MTFWQTLRFCFQVKNERKKEEWLIWGAGGATPWTFFDHLLNQKSSLGLVPTSGVMTKHIRELWSDWSLYSCKNLGLLLSFVVFQNNYLQPSINPSILWTWSIPIQGHRVPPAYPETLRSASPLWTCFYLISILPVTIPVSFLFIYFWLHYTIILQWFLNCPNN